MKLYGAFYIAKQGGRIVSCGVYNSLLYKDEETAWQKCREYAKEKENFFNGDCECHEDEFNHSTIVENSFYATEFTWSVYQFEYNENEKGE